MKAFLMVPQQPGLAARHVPLRFVERGGGWQLVDRNGWPFDHGYALGLADVLEARISTDCVETVNTALGLPPGNPMVVEMRRRRHAIQSNGQRENL
jgi:hypothetical protein